MGESVIISNKPGNEPGSYLAVSPSPRIFAQEFRTFSPDSQLRGGAGSAGWD